MEKRSIYIVLGSVAVIMLLLSLAGAAATISFQQLSNDQMNLFGANMVSGDVVVDSQDTKVKGKEGVEVELTLNNTAASSRTVNVTVQSLDSSDNLLAESRKQLTISGSTTQQEAFTLSDGSTNFAQKHDETYIIVDQQ